jgi:hypothetical protein
MLAPIEKLQQQFTDQYVVVDATVPELARFEGQVGQVKTVNMSGRALVQFDCWNNIGWYDIEVDFLKIVPKPEPAAEAQKHDARQAAPRPAKPAAAAGEKKLSPLDLARQQGAAKSPAQASAPAADAKRATADILAAARGAKPAGAAPPAKPAAEKKAAPAASPAKPAAGKMSTADILAAARAKQSGEGAVAEAAPPAAVAKAAEAVAVEPPAAAPPAPSKAAAPKAAAPKAAAPGKPGERPTVGEILAWCRQHDAK